jgi:hypothetical protein
LFVSGFAGAVAMSFAERLVIGLVILGLVLGIILLWLVSSPTGPCEDLGDWAKPVCRHLTWPGGELFNFPMRRSRAAAIAGGLSPPAADRRNARQSSIDQDQYGAS